MLWKPYPTRRISAMPALFFAAMAALLMLSACQKTAVTPPSQVSKPTPVVVHGDLVSAPQRSAEIASLMSQTTSEDELQHVLIRLDALIGAGGPLAEEALFRKAELMLARDVPGAEQTVAMALSRYPRHALVPYAYVWRAEWWIRQDEGDRALADMHAALLHPYLTRELADRILTVGPASIHLASETVAVDWLLAAANVDKESQESWLRLAARRSSLATVERVFSDMRVARSVLPSYALYSAQAHLMAGDAMAVNRIKALLQGQEPRARQMEQLQSWAAGEMRAATIGIMLPLSGAYARYGKQALQGIRVALSSLDSAAYITLRVEDTGSNAEQAIAAYRQLQAESVNMIVGPLLVDSAQAILPYLSPDLPVISLTGHTELAGQSPALFIHTLSPLAQVTAMASYAWHHGARRMVVISESGTNQSESEMFSASFTALGGEVLQTLQLPAEGMDYRDELRRLRFETDDDEQLALLDEELAVFLPPMDMEIRMPVSFDAAYLALPGRKVALLGGQLAYADINGVNLYGSSRWQDGHLLDDRGRYLSKSRFVAAGEQAGGENEDPALNRIHFMLREAWGDAKTPELLLLAYDSMRIAAMLTSRLGLNARAIQASLHQPEGFPAVTGHVYFDDAGIGQKQLDIFTIRKGKIEPAG